MELLRLRQQKASLFSTHHSHKLFFDKLRYRLGEYFIEELEASGFVLATAMFVACFALGSYFFEETREATYVGTIVLVLCFLWLLTKRWLIVAVVALGLFYPWLGHNLTWQTDHVQSLSYRSVTAFDARVDYITIRAERNGNVGRRIGLTLLSPAAGLPKGQLVRLNVPPHNAHGVNIGDKVHLRASLTPLSRSLVAGEFSYRSYFAARGISAVGRTLSAIEVIEPSRSSGVFDGFFLAKLRYKIAQTIYNYLPENPEAAGVAVALVTGVRDGIPSDVKEHIRRSGLAHLLAISGLHIGMVATFIMAVSSFLWACSIRLSARYDARLYVGGFAVLVALAYALLSGYNIPAQRSFVMLVMVLFALILARATLSRHTLAMAVWAVLLFNPNALGNASFQLSFVATLAIVAFYQDILNGESFLLRYNTFQRPLLVKHYPVQLLLCSLLATTSTMPFVLYHFDYFSLMGVVANFVGITLVAIVILPFSLLASFSEYFSGFLGGGEGSLALGWVWQVIAGCIDVLLLTAKQASIWSEDYSIEGGSSIDLAYVVMGFGVVVTGVLRTKLRWIGLVICLVGVGISLIVERSLPLVVISPEKGTIAVIDDEARRLMVSDSKNTFVTHYWRRHFGLKTIEVLTDGYSEIINNGITFGLRCKESRCLLGAQEGDKNGAARIVLGYLDGVTCTRADKTGTQNWCILPRRVEVEDCDDTKNERVIDMIRLRCDGAHSLFWRGNNGIEKVTGKE